MSNNYSYTISVTFRIKTQKFETIDKLRNYDHAFDINSSHDGSGYIITLDIDHLKDYSWVNSAIVDSGLGICDSDIFVSLRSCFDTGIIDLPDWIRRLITIINAKIVLSYTII